MEIRERLFSVNFSIDAESKLRTNDRLDLEKVKNYLDSAVTGYTGRLD